MKYYSRAPHQGPFCQKRPNPASRTFSLIALGAAGTCPSYAQQQGPALPPASSFEDLGRGSEILGG